jgi:hypothetical protein
MNLSLEHLDLSHLPSFRNNMAGCKRINLKSGVYLEKSGSDYNLVGGIYKVPLPDKDVICATTQACKMLNSPVIDFNDSCGFLLKGYDGYFIEGNWFVESLISRIQLVTYQF